MPRNAGRNIGNKAEYQKNHPDKVFGKLELARQIACYNFWLHLVSRGEEGWNPTKTPGTMNHWKNSLYLQKQIKKQSWNRVGQVRTQVLVLVVLAERPSSSI